MVTVEEYLRMVEKPAYEYRDGIVSQKSMPTWLHGLIRFTLATLLQRVGLQASVEVRCYISQDKYLVPDVVAASQIQHPYPTEPVLLCCEIMSPDDHIGATLAKCEEYHAWGVPYCWIVDPQKRTAWEYAASGEPNRVSGTLQAGDITVSLDELFAALPKQ